ncbi:MAG: hypothetical protein MUD08_08120 [Cytophagales bacterium]|nr:hypothetical protein [Cytophagales bacterium]
MESTNNQVIAIQNKAGKELSKLQKQFNNYTRRVEKLKKELRDTETILDKARQKVNETLLPLEKKKFDLKAEILWVLDRQHDALPKRDREKLSEFISEQAHMLIERFGKEELKPLFEKHEQKSFEEHEQEMNQKTGETMKQMFEMFGIDLDEDADLSDVNTFKEAYERKAESEQARFEERQAKRKKTPKQLEKEEKLKQEAHNITKTVQSAYRQLVKEFHPDREQNSIERERKTLIMQRITAAYEADDLFELLRLQLEYNQKDSGDFALLPDEQLKYYNKLLKEQINELEDELWQLQSNDNPFQPSFYQTFCTPPERLDANIKREVTHMKKELKTLEEEKKAFEEPAYIKQFLKEYRQMQKQMAKSPFGGLF